VIGTQRNNGAECFVQGNIMPELTVFGGVTWIDARLLDTGVAATNGKLVVGVPTVKSDVAVDYHPVFMRGFALTGAIHAESSRAATNTNNSFAPAYATFDLGIRASGTFDKRTATARFQVLNVGNTFIIHRLPTATSWKSRRQHRLPWNATNLHGQSPDGFLR